MTVADLQALVLAQAFPSGGPPENLSSILDSYVITALIEIQRAVPCFRFRHDDVIPATGTYWHCGTSMVDLPRGRVLRVYTVQDRTGNGKEWCQPVPYSPASLRDLRRYQSKFNAEWVHQFYVPKRPSSLPLGFNIPDFSSDAVCGRAMSGRYALDDTAKRLVVAPWLQTYECLVIEWQGIKRSWRPTDTVPDDPDFLRLVRLFVEREHGRRWGCNDLAIREGAFNECRADMIATCKEETDLHGEPATAAEIDQAFTAWWSGPVSLEEIHRAVEPETPFVRVSAVGDSGIDNEAAAAVAALLMENNPDGWHLALGDNVYQPLTISEALAPYQKWIENNRLRIILGNHDLDQGDLGAAELAFAGPHPINALGHSRWYSQVIGPIEFFIVDSGLNSAGQLVEPDGNWEGSLQSQQIHAAILRSQARWRILCLHHSPFTSAINYGPGLVDVRWVSALPVHAVISAHSHQYERLSIGNRTHIVVGTGGADLYDFGTPIDGSEVRLGVHGALLIDADCNQICLRFLDTNGAELDSLCISDVEPALFAFSVIPILAECPALGSLTQFQTITPVQINASGGDGGPYTFTAIGLPDGLSVSSTGLVSGTPTAEGNFNYQLTVADSTSLVVVPCLLHIDPPPEGSFPIRIGYAPSVTETTLSEAQILALDVSLNQTTRNYAATIPYISQARHFFIAIDAALGCGTNTGSGSTAGFSLGVFPATMGSPSSPQPFGSDSINGYSFEPVTVAGSLTRLFRFSYPTAGPVPLTIR